MMRVNEMEDIKLDKMCIHCGHNELVFTKPKLKEGEMITKEVYNIYLGCEACGKKTKEGVHAPGQRDGEIPYAQQRTLIGRFDRGDIV